jgi:hypothetical protein
MTLSPDADFSKMVYNGSDNMTLTYFRGGLAMCDSDSYVYYDTGGSLLVEDRINYSSPVLAESDKYLMVYDVGGRNYAIYNQLTEIISRETIGDIVAGDIADDGSFVVASRSRETRYVVELYNSSFKKVMGIYKENYILDTALSPDGKLVVICSAVPSDTGFFRRDRRIPCDRSENADGAHVFLPGRNGNGAVGADVLYGKSDRYSWCGIPVRRRTVRGSEVFRYFRCGKTDRSAHR